MSSNSLAFAQVDFQSSTFPPHALADSSQSSLNIVLFPVLFEFERLPKAAETFPIKVVNFLHVGFVFLSLSSFFLGGTRATVLQERPGQQKEGTCGRSLSVRKRLLELFTGASYERHKKLWEILVLFIKNFPALLFYDDQSFLCTERWVCIQFFT